MKNIIKENTKSKMDTDIVEDRILHWFSIAKEKGISISRPCFQNKALQIAFGYEDPLFEAFNDILEKNYIHYGKLCGIEFL